jgi:hypothetical protein
MKTFYIAEDYTAKSIWDQFLLVEMLTLPSKPHAWDRPENTLPEGNWEVCLCMWQHASDNAWRKAGIPKPQFDELPCIFCVDENGTVDVQYNLADAAQAAAFIAARI